MSEYLERTNASKPTFGDYVTLEMKRYGVPNEYFIHDVMTHPFTSNSWRNVPIDARDPEEHLHDMSETVISVCTQGFHLSGWHIFNVRLSDVLPMKGDKWAWKESPLRSRIAELEAAQRWIPVSEPPKECEMRVFKDGNAWCFVLPDFQDLQVSSSVWMKEGVLDKIYKELRSVRNE
jgi:hypothetical protein